MAARYEPDEAGIDRMEDKNAHLERRDFLRLLGTGAAASVVALSGCDPKDRKSGAGAKAGDVPTDRTAYRM
jgi:hypothetical protein